MVIISFRWLAPGPEMVFLALIGVLRGFAAAAYKRTPHRNPLCGLDQNQKSSFPDRPLILVNTAINCS
jgi:hypothetical protein